MNVVYISCGTVIHAISTFDKYINKQSLFERYIICRAKRITFQDQNPKYQI